MLGPRDIIYDSNSEKVHLEEGLCLRQAGFCTVCISAIAGTVSRVEDAPWCPSAKQKTEECHHGPLRHHKVMPLNQFWLHASYIMKHALAPVQAPHNSASIGTAMWCLLRCTHVGPSHGCCSG